jgi:hypothetical protein
MIEEDTKLGSHISGSLGIYFIPRFSDRVKDGLGVGFEKARIS